MNFILQKSPLVLWLIGLLAFAEAGIVQAQTTAFTYQGQLSSGTNPANGSYDLRFALYDANVAGNFIAGPITNTAVPVTNGLFTVTLDFGAGVFTGTNYWAEMGVRTNGSGSFATLIPRQQLTPAPYALSLVSPQATALCPPGSVIAYMGTNAPTGWLMCDGSAVSRTQYASLFAVIGTSSGAGNGSTTFNLPDTRGRTLVGSGLGAGLSSRTLGQTFGEESHTLTTNEMPSHVHGVNDPGHYHIIQKSGLLAAGGANYGVTGPDGPGHSSTNTTGITLQNSGLGAAHNVMQPSFVMNYIIKY